jgi:hypothetical protein
VKLVVRAVYDRSNTTDDVTSAPRQEKPDFRMLVEWMPRRIERPANIG